MKELLCLLLLSISTYGEVYVSDLIENQTHTTSVHSNAHIVNDCESGTTKKIAHILDSHNQQKQLDNQMILGDNQGCITGYDENLALRGILAPIYNQACIQNNRQSKERERRDGKDGIVNGISTLVNGVMLFKSLGGL